MASGIALECEIHPDYAFAEVRDAVKVQFNKEKWYLWVDEMRLKAVRIQFLNIKFHKGGTQMKREMAMLALSAAVAWDV